MIVGAYALGSHGFPRATGDIDIWVKVDKENASRICKSLIEFGAPKEHFDEFVTVLYCFHANLKYVESKILLVRGKKVMRDRDLAKLYGIETRTLNQTVKRNNERFPNDFMFQLAKTEANLLVLQNVIPSKRKIGFRAK